MSIGIKNPVYIQGKDGMLTELNVGYSIELTPRQDMPDYKEAYGCEFSMELYQDICVKRLIETIIDPRLGSNNWRKYHGLPMWRSR